DRQGPRPHHPAVTAAAGGSADRVMDRRRFVLTSLAGAVVASLAAEAQYASRIPRIAFLTTTSPGRSPATDAFVRGLRELGYVEGQNIVSWSKTTSVGRRIT